MRMFIFHLIACFLISPVLSYAVESTLSGDRQASGSNPPSVGPSPSSAGSQDRTTPNSSGILVSSPSEVTQPIKQAGEQQPDTTVQPSSNQQPQQMQQLPQQQSQPQTSPATSQQLQQQQQPQSIQQQQPLQLPQQQQLQQMQQQQKQLQMHPQLLQKFQQMQQQQQLQQQQQQQQRQSMFHQQPILPKQQLPQQQQHPSSQLQSKHTSQPQITAQLMQTSSARGPASLARSSSPGANIRMATSPLSRDTSPGVATSHPGSMAASTSSSLPMYMTSPGGNYPTGSVVTSNRPLIHSAGMYSTSGLPGQTPSTVGYPINQSSLPPNLQTAISGMQYAGQRSGIPPSSNMPNRPTMPNYGQSFSGPPSQPPAYSAQRIPDSPAYPPGFMSSPGSQHPPSSN